MAFTKRFDQIAICGFELARVVLEPRQKFYAAFSGDGFVCGGKSLRELFEAFDTEELCAKWRPVSITGRLTD
jgi:hypothetical protein